MLFFLSVSLQLNCNSSSQVLQVWRGFFKNFFWIFEIQLHSNKLVSCLEFSANSPIWNRLRTQNTVKHICCKSIWSIWSIWHSLSSLVDAIWSRRSLIHRSGSWILFVEHPFRRAPNLHLRTAGPVHSCSRLGQEDKDDSHFDSHFDPLMHLENAKVSQ